MKGNSGENMLNNIFISLIVLCCSLSLQAQSIDQFDNRGIDSRGIEGRLSISNVEYGDDNQCKSDINCSLRLTLKLDDKLLTKRQRKKTKLSVFWGDQRKLKVNLSKCIQMGTCQYDESTGQVSFSHQYSEGQYQAGLKARLKRRNSINFTSSEKVLINIEPVSVQPSCTPNEDGACEPISLSSDGNQPYRAIGRLRGVLSCTASYIRTSFDPSAPAYILSNGHCLIDPFSRSSQNNIVVDKNISSTVEFNFFEDTLNDTIKIKSSKVEYATMKGVDIAIAKLDKTIGEMSELGIEPLNIVDSLPSVNGAVNVVGAPLYRRHLQSSLCEYTRKTDVIEGFWHWFESTENTCLGIASGSSGSPILNDSGEVFAVLNTTNLGAYNNECLSGQPCGFVDKKPKLTTSRNYGSSVTTLLQCFNSEGLFSLTGSCTLPKESQISINDYPYFFANPDIPSRFDEILEWDFNITADESSYFRTKLAKVSDGENCQELEGYGEIKQGYEDFSRVPLPNEHGYYQYCVIGSKNKLDWNSSDLSIVQVYLDKEAPTPGALSIRLIGDQIGFDPIFNAVNSGYKWFIGSVDTTCSEDILKDYFRFPMYKDSADLPIKVCLRSNDYAGNNSYIGEYILDSEEHQAILSSEKQSLYIQFPSQ